MAKQNDIDTLPKLTRENFANNFNVTLNSDGNYIYNPCRSIYFDNPDNLAPEYYEIYTIQDKDTLFLISYKFYDTIELWWLVAKVNDLDPMKNLKAGKRINILKNDIVDSILLQMRNL